MGEWSEAARDRLREACKKIGSHAAIHAATGIPTPTIQKVLQKDGGEPGISRVAKLAAAAGVTVDFILNGSKPIGAQIAEGIHKDLQAIVLSTHGASQATYAVPIRDVVVSAGAGGEAISARELDHLVFPEAMLRRIGPLDKLELVPIRGDSMEPELRDGDLAMVDTSRTDRTEGLLVLTVGDRLVAKRLRLAGGGRLQLVSNNPAYPPIDVEPIEDLRIHGRVVWAGKAF